jgi:hypothetical protein
MLAKMNAELDAHNRVIQADRARVDKAYAGVRGIAAKAGHVTSLAELQRLVKQQVRQHASPLLVLTPSADARSLDPSEDKRQVSHVNSCKTN